MLGLSFNLLGHPVIAHFERFRSMYDHSANFCSLNICDWMYCMLSDIIVRPFAYAVVVHVEGDVLKWYPMSSFSSNLNSNSRNIIKKYGLSVSPCMVPRLIVIGGVVSKWLPVKDVVEFL